VIKLRILAIEIYVVVYHAEVCLHHSNIGNYEVWIIKSELGKIIEIGLALCAGGVLGQRIKCKP